MIDVQYIYIYVYIYICTYKYYDGKVYVEDNKSSNNGCTHKH